MKPLLIKFDLGLLKRIELEVAATSKEQGRDVHRTEVIRDLITESLDSRCVRRQDVVPYVIPVSDAELHQDEAEDESEGSGSQNESEALKTLPRRSEAETVQFTIERDHVWMKDPKYASEYDKVLTRGATLEVTYSAGTPDRAGTVATAEEGDVFTCPPEAGSGSDGSGANPGPAPMGVALVRPVGSEDFASEGTTAIVGREAGARVEGDASEERSGGNQHELAAVDGLGVPEVGTAGGRGWLGDSVKPIGLSPN
jgi:hypothetical protein